MFCAQCGTVIRSEWQFCRYCGHRLIPEPGSVTEAAESPGQAIAWAATAALSGSPDRTAPSDHSPPPSVPRRPLVSLASVLLAALGLQAVIEIVRALRGFVLAGRLADLPPRPSLADLFPLQAEFDTLAMLEDQSLLLVVLTAVVWLVWQAQHTLWVRAWFGGRKPGRGSVWWWFVPVAQLWMPYLTLRRLWEQVPRASRPPAAFGWWWGFWVASIVANALPGGLYADVERYAGIAVMARVEAGVYLASAVAAVLAMQVISGFRRQSLAAT